ncbi:ATP-dependent DNA helicase [Trichonephila clavipes]|nr:ATP-dependent DNA helicase [Trichonephila clavipes]
MPPKRRAIGRSTLQARKRRALRASESDEQRALRLENLRLHATETECFYLRLLLINIRGPISFQDLRTVNGQLCATYRQACQELKLLENNAHWDTTLADTSNTARPQQIRTLFAMILTTCFPSNPKHLWEKYKDYMSEDILHRLRAANQNFGHSIHTKRV